MRSRLPLFVLLAACSSSSSSPGPACALTPGTYPRTARVSAPVLACASPPAVKSQALVLEAGPGGDLLAGFDGSPDVCSSVVEACSISLQCRGPGYQMTGTYTADPERRLSGTETWDTVPADPGCEEKAEIASP